MGYVDIDNELEDVEVKALVARYAVVIGLQHIEIRHTISLKKRIPTHSSTGRETPASPAGTLPHTFMAHPTSASALSSENHPLLHSLPHDPAINEGHEMSVAEASVDNQRVLWSNGR